MDSTKWLVVWLKLDKMIIIIIGILQIQANSVCLYLIGLDSCALYSKLTCPLVLFCDIVFFLLLS